MIRLISLLLIPLFLFGAVGKVLAVRGDVTLHRGASTLAAVPGTALETNDRIVTGTAAKAQLRGSVRNGREQPRSRLHRGEGVL